MTTTIDAQNMVLERYLQTATIDQIAKVIRKDWGSKVYFGAVPYLNAMFYVSTLDSQYGVEDGRTQVIYFLANAQTWRGNTAKLVKAELNKRLKASR